MKYLVLITILLATLTDPTSIGKINRVKKEAQEAYLKADFQTAIKKYSYLVDSLQIDEAEVRINLANAYFQVKDSARAQTTYQGLLDTPNTTIRSKAYQQLGVLHHQQGNLEAALYQFKEAIKADPKNGSARYDYEMLKKKLNDKQEQEKNQDQQNKDQKQDQDQNKDKNKDQKQDQDQDQQRDKDKKDKEKDQQSKQDQNNADKNQDQKDKGQQDKSEDQKESDKKDQNKNDASENEDKEKDDGESSEQQTKEAQDRKRKEEIKKSLEEMNISEETARMIMEAMKNNEVQYLQQNQRKATQSRDKSKPDW
jgi:Ca-activated chloride channel family protein